jgi:hypothetical protein
MNRCYAFPGRWFIWCPPRHLVVADLLTQLLWRYTQMVRRIIRCWRTPHQNLTVHSFETIGWTATDPSVHPVLLHWSWRISVLFKLDHWIERQFPPVDRWFIWRYCLPLLRFCQLFDASRIETVRSYDGAKLIPASAQCTKCNDACTDGTIGSSDGGFSLFSHVFDLFLCFFDCSCIHGT